MNNRLTLSKVIISTTIHQTLSLFALSNELEEVAALLLGQFENDDSGHARIGKILGYSLLSRKEKKKDRVEINEIQLSNVMNEAESKGLQVIGWMHSHPRITILPSQVDLNTQLSFQTLEPRFLGLIYGCFHENPNLSMRLQLLAFQALSTPSAIEKLDVPIELQLECDSKYFIPKLLDIAELYVIEELMENDESQPSFEQLNQNAPAQTFARLSHMKTSLQIASSSLRLSKIHQSLVRPILFFLKDGSC